MQLVGQKRCSFRSTDTGVISVFLPRLLCFLPYFLESFATNRLCCLCTAFIKVINHVINFTFDIHENGFTSMQNALIGYFSFCVASPPDIPAGALPLAPPLTPSPDPYFLAPQDILLDPPLCLGPFQASCAPNLCMVATSREWSCTGAISKALQVTTGRCKYDSQSNRTNRKYVHSQPLITLNKLLIDLTVY